MILSLECDFLAQVKGNCSSLLQNIQLFTSLTQAFSTYEYFENTKGNQITRFVELYNNITELPKGWNGIEQFVKVRRYGYRSNKRFDEVSYYVSSKKFSSAAQAAKAVQGEDDMTLRTPKKAAMLACFNNIAINILRKNGYKPTKATFAKIANKVKELYKLFIDI